jgi:hypothetical protein
MYQLSAIEFIEISDLSHDELASFFARKMFSSKKNKIAIREVQLKFFFICRKLDTKL